MRTTLFVAVVLGLEVDRAAAVHGLDGVVHEIDDDAPDLLLIDADLGQPVGEVAPEFDLGEESLIERQRLVQERVQVGRHGTRRRHARELRELVHQPLERLDLADDRRRALIDERARRLGRLREMAPEPLGAELNRRQRVLDLVRQPARHLAPRRGLLRANERRDVVEDHHHAIGRAIVAAQRRGHHREMDLAPFERDRDVLRTHVVTVA